MIVYFTKMPDGKVLLTDRKTFVKKGQANWVGFPEFVLEVTNRLDETLASFEGLLQLKEGESVKMVLRHWPIE